MLVRMEEPCPEAVNAVAFGFKPPAVIPVAADAADEPVAPAAAVVNTLGAAEAVESAANPAVRVTGNKKSEISVMTSTVEVGSGPPRATSVQVMVLLLGMTQLTSTVLRRDGALVPQDCQGDVQIERK